MVKRKQPDPARREHLHRIEETLKVLRRWAPDSQALPSKDELRAFKQLYLKGESETQPLLVFRVWADRAPSLATAKQLATESTHADLERSVTIASTFLGNPVVPQTDVLGDAGDVLSDLFFPGDPISIETVEGVWRFGRPLKWDIVWDRLSWWLHASLTNPRCYALRRLELMWRFDPKRVELEEDIGSGIPIRTLMQSCAHFIEPSGFPGDDTLKRRLATKLREEFERRDLPPAFAKIWQRVQTRSGRSPNWDQRLEPGKKVNSDLPCTYGALAIHNTQVDASLLRILTGTIRDLGWFDGMSSEPEAVDLGRQLHREMFARLGYEKGDQVPAYRVRISTNAEFTDSEEARIHLDVLVPLPGSGAPSEDLPTVLLAPRPDKPYARLGVAYELNLRMLRRVFHRDAGTRLWTYTTCGFVDGRSLKKAVDVEGPGLFRCKLPTPRGQGPRRRSETRLPGLDWRPPTTAHLVRPGTERVGEVLDCRPS